MAKVNLLEDIRRCCNNAALVLDMSEGSCGRVVEDRTVNRGDGGSIPPTAVSKRRQFRSPHICLCLLEGTLKSSWSLLSGVYARGSKRSYTGGKCVTCSGLTNSHWTLNPCKGPHPESERAGAGFIKRHIFTHN